MSGLAADGAAERALERRCRRLTRVYPDARRGAEVLTTLMESNAGRRVPRVRDAVNVLWHAAAARLGNRAPGTRFAEWGDAASVAVVTLAVTYAATAVAVATAYGEVGTDGRYLIPYWQHEMFRTSAEAAATAAFAVVAVLAATAMAFGRVRLSRVAVAVAAATGVAAAGVSVAEGNTLAPAASPLAACVAVYLVVAGVTCWTTAVARAARVAPTWWWGMAGLASALVAHRAVASAGTPFNWNRPGVVVGVAVPAVALALLVLAAPPAREFPEVFAGAALAALPAVPFATLFVEYSTNSGIRPLHLLVGSTAGWLLLAGAVLCTLRPRAQAPAPPADDAGTPAGG